VALHERALCRRQNVERALEKLRGLLARRGVTIAAVLASVISIPAVQTAPAGLAAMLATTSLAGASAATLSFWNNQLTVSGDPAQASPAPPQ
jgi:hypothetical protein